VSHKSVETPRLEDEPLLRGKGRFVDDIRLPGMLEAAFVRSAEPHALIRHIDKTAALALPGVHAVLTLDDLRPHLTTERLAVGLPSPPIARRPTGRSSPATRSCMWASRLRSWWRRAVTSRRTPQHWST
jgi:CO/xanthine dehydrogenase Mo-binding subunit